MQRKKINKNTYHFCNNEFENQLRDYYALK